MATNPGQVYDLANRLIERSRTRGHNEIAQRLDDALHVGSSALETLGAIAAVLVDKVDVLETMADRAEIDAAVRYVEKVFGKE